jgi:Fe-S-cluster containining protein
MAKAFPVPVRVQYNCNKCPAYCCTYAQIEVSDFDIGRLARHFGVSPREAKERFTKYDAQKDSQVLRHRKDGIFDSACTFLDQKTRKCTVYEARPRTCRVYPESKRCGYYEFLKFEREQQGDDKFIALT